MPTHRVDINRKGTSYFVDNQFRSSTGFPFWENQLPDGLHLERRVGRPAKKDHKFVRTPGFGRSVEWTSNEDAYGARGQNQAVPPRRQQQGRYPGVQRGERPVQNVDQVHNQDPGLFDVPEGDSEDGDDDDDNDDRNSRAASRRDDPGFARYQDHDGHLRGYDDADRAVRAQSSVFMTSREEPLPWLKHRRLCQWEHDHGGDPRGYGPHRAMRARSTIPVRSYREEPPPWLELRELRQWERERGIRR